jgi:glycosyltransferase involved in cell wall biosynthesis
MWHVCDVRPIWLREFTAALAANVPVLGWLPSARVCAWPQKSEVSMDGDASFPTWRFRLQLGFRRFPVRLVLDERRRVLTNLSRIDPGFDRSTLVISFPTYHWLAPHWPGRTVYYVTDLFGYWADWRDKIRQMERALCRHVDLVCPNSTRLADYLIEELRVPPHRVVVIPNATPSDDILPVCPGGPAALPSDLADMPRPVAGVIGNLAGNLDWPLIEEIVRRTPWLSWAFVGPTDMAIPFGEEAATRERLMKRESLRIRFVGARPYRTLREYARSFDVAILPYKKIEPTFSGSSTRFYAHLAACRPMLATTGFQELLHKQPLLKLARNADEMVVELERLRSLGFSDGLEKLRWEASRTETWEFRAKTMMAALEAANGS